MIFSSHFAIGDCLKKSWEIDDKESFSGAYTYVYCAHKMFVESEFSARFQKLAQAESAEGISHFVIC